MVRGRSHAGVFLEWCRRHTEQEAAPGTGGTCRTFRRRDRRPARRRFALFLCRNASDVTTRRRRPAASPGRFADRREDRRSYSTVGTVGPLRRRRARQECCSGSLRRAAPDDRSGSTSTLKGIVSGLGSNPVGLDRGQVGEPQILRLRELGGKVLFELVNLRFRALTGSAEEVRAVEESFANSVIWSAEIVARDDDGSSLIDLGPFLLRDAHGIAESLAESGQGAFSVDRDRGAIDIERCRAFPDNLEFESLVTFTGTKPGGEVRGVAVEPRALSFVQHQSLVRLPRRRLQAARVRSPDGLLRDPLPGLFGSTRCLGRASLDRPPSPAEERPCGRALGGARSRSSTTSTGLFPSQSAAHFSKAQDGGPKLSRRRALKAASGSSSCRKEPIRWMCATT